MNTFFMLDRRFLSPQAIENMAVRIAQPVKDTANNPLFTEDRPWELRIDNGYPNVLYDEKVQVYRCYYTLFIEDEDSRIADRSERASRDYIPRSDRVPGLCYAESRDGIHWEKPNLGKTLWQGNTDNNIIFPFAHGTGVMIDERDPDPARRYKMVTKMDQPGQEAYMAVSFSADGISWQQPIPWPEFNPPADSHNLPFWSEEEQCYMLVSRIWKDGIRITTLSKCDDFLHWSEPKETLRGQGFENQIYAMPVFYWKGLYLGFASMIHEGDRTTPDFDKVDLELTCTADPTDFDFVAYGQKLIPRGEGSYPDGAFDSSCIYASPPVLDPDGSMWIYYMGGNGCHTNFRESSLARARWEADKFAALEPRDSEETSITATCRLDVTGNALEILADPVNPEKPCKMEIALHTFWNQDALDGFGYENSRGEKTQDGWLRVEFEGHSLEELKDQKVCIKLRTENVKLWAVRGDLAMKEHRLWEGAI